MEIISIRARCQTDYDAPGREQTERKFDQQNLINSLRLVKLTLKEEVEINLTHS